MALADYINEKPVIETRYLVLRPFKRSDLESLKSWMNDSRLYTYWGKGPGKADKDPQLLFEQPKKPVKSFHLGIEEKSSQRVIGDIWVYLIENNRMASVAIRMASESQNQGYGTEAMAAMSRFCFEKTELQRLWAEVDVRNIASQRMLEKCGFTKEGMIRQGKMVNTWCDYYIYGLLKSDYRQTVERIEEMEKKYDRLSEAANSDPDQIERDPELKRIKNELSEYLDGGQWQIDYQLDEAGILPEELKRGVLSQDGLYDLLEELS